MTHWKQEFNYAYTGAYELQPGEERTLTIRELKNEEVVASDGRKEVCFVAYFVGDSKPMILNKTNCKTISKLYGPYIEEWPGKAIVIKAEKVKAFGEVVEALRVKNVKPETAKIDITAQVNMLRACQSMEQLQTVFMGFTSAQKNATGAVKDEMKLKLSAK